MLTRDDLFGFRERLCVSCCKGLLEYISTVGCCALQCLEKDVNINTPLFDLRTHLCQPKINQHTYAVILTQDYIAGREIAMNYTGCMESADCLPCSVCSLWVEVLSQKFPVNLLHYNCI